MTKLDKIEGFEAVLAQKLAPLSIRTLDELLIAGRTVADRKMLASRARVTTRTITRWVTIADLMRVSGVHIKYAKLLQSAGITTVQELANRNPAHLHEQIEMINRMGRKQVSRVPAISRIECWVEEAMRTDTMMETHSELLVAQF